MYTIIPVCQHYIGSDIFVQGCFKQESKLRRKTHQLAVQPSANGYFVCLALALVSTDTINVSKKMKSDHKL